MNLFGQILGPAAPLAVSDTLSAIWQDEVSNFGAVGGIIGVYAPGKWYWAGATGNALLNPSVLADTAMHFRAGSLSKSFVAASLLKLQEQGTLDLDDLISIWLPPTLINIIPNGNQISIRQLLNHKSGIGNYSSSAGFIATVLTQGTGHVFTPEELVGFGASQGASFPPGNSWEYSNTNYVLAALVIESASNLPYESYVENNLLNPLSLASTYFPTTDTLPGSFMGSYYDIDNTPPRENFSYINPSSTYGSGALVSKLADMISWLRALKDGQILNSSSQAEMLNFINSTLPNTDYGLGIGLYDNGNLSALGHTGSVFNTSNMQYVYTSDYYVVYNVTDLDFDNFSFINRLQDYLEAYFQACANFQPGNINSPPRIGLNTGDTVPLTGPNIGGVSYQWYLNGQAISGAQSFFYTATVPGDYTLEMTNSLGCSSITDRVIVEDCSPYQVSIDNVGPTADFCAGDTVELSAGGALDNIIWLNPNGIPLQSSSNTYRFVPQQNTFLQMLASDSIGCSSLDTLQYQVLPLPVSNIGMDIIDCPNTPVSLQTGTAGDRVDWFNQNGGLLQSNTPSYSFTLQTTGKVIAAVTNACGTSRDTVEFEVLPSPLSDIGNDIEDCQGSQQFLGAGQIGDSVIWYDLLGNVLLNNNRSYNFVLQNTGGIIAEVNNACGQDRDTVLLTAIPPPVVDLGPDFSSCTGSMLSFTVGDPGDLVNWFEGNGNLLSANANTYNFVLNSSLSLVAERITSCGSSRDTVQIEANFTASIDIGPDLRVCKGTEVILSPGNTPDQVNWLDESGTLLLANAAEYPIIITEDQEIIAELISTCGTATDTLQITAVDLPLVDLGPDTNIVLGSRITLEAGMPGDIVNWYDGMGNLLLGNNTTYFTNPQGPISLVVEVITPDGCVGRDSIFVDVTVSVDRPEDIGLHIFPNPTSESLSINWEKPNGKNWEWEMLDLTGKQVSTGYSSEKNLILHVHSLSKGIYLLRIKRGEQEAIQRISITH